MSPTETTETVFVRANIAILGIDRGQTGHVDPTDQNVAAHLELGDLTIITGDETPPATVHAPAGRIQQIETVETETEPAAEAETTAPVNARPKRG